MLDLIRDAPLGQLIRLVTHNRVLQYPEEQPDFRCPGCYTSDAYSKSAEDQPPSLSSATFGAEVADPEKTADFTKADLKPSRKNSLAEEPDGTSESPLGLSRTITDQSLQQRGTTRIERTRSNMSRVSSRIALEKSTTRADLEQAFDEAILEENEPTKVVTPGRLPDGTILVDWYTTSDPANPQNWSLVKKSVVASQIYFYTLAVYMGSSIYTSSEPGVMARFGVGETAASLGLSLYVLAYGIGPLLFSPLSEIPRIGRNPPYMISYAIFVILCLPTALVDNFAGLLVLRFLQGFFGSPCLATGGATLQDMFSLIKLPHALLLWAFAATCGPALGPVISGFSVAAENWRWSLWEMLWLSGPVWLLMVAALPETNPSNILLRRAERLRKITGNDRLLSQSEIDQTNLKFNDLVTEALVRPVQLILLDPVIAYVDIYIALCYGIYYSFFEVTPRVYIERYHFNLGEMGLVFLSITVGVIVTMIAYSTYVYTVIEPDIRARGLGAPERRLIPALFSTPLIPIGLFIFAWTTNGSIHWIVGCIGIALFIVGLFTLFQCVFVYLPLTYPQFAASLFAGNDFVRSVLAAAAILFAKPLFDNLGVGPGVSLLAALTSIMVAGVYILFLYGHKLRAKSRFSAK